MTSFCTHCGQVIPDYNGIKTVPDRLEVHFNGKFTCLTSREFQIWTLLMSKPGSFFSRDKIIHLIYDPNGSSLSDNMTVDTLMHRLRKKLTSVGLMLASRHRSNLGWRVEVPSNG